MIAQQAHIPYFISALPDLLLFVSSLMFEFPLSSMSPQPRSDT